MWKRWVLVRCTSKVLTPRIYLFQYIWFFFSVYCIYTNIISIYTKYIIHMQTKKTQLSLEKTKKTKLDFEGPKWNCWDSQTAKSTLATEKPASILLATKFQHGMSISQDEFQRLKTTCMLQTSLFLIWMPFIYILQGPYSFETHLYTTYFWKMCTHCTCSLCNVAEHPIKRTLIFTKNVPRRKQIVGVPRRRWSSWRRLAR